MELWEILSDLLDMLNRGFKRITIQMDNLEVAKALQENMMTDSSITMVKRVQRIMRTYGQ